MFFTLVLTFSWRKISEKFHEENLVQTVVVLKLVAEYYHVFEVVHKWYRTVVLNAVFYSEFNYQDGLFISDAESQSVLHHRMLDTVLIKSYCSVAFTCCFLLAQRPFLYIILQTGEEVAMFWRTYCWRHFRLLCNVARALLGAPASATVLDRNFGETGKLASHQRGSLGATYVEMILYLRGAYDYIPETIPKLTAERAEKAPLFHLRGPLYS